MISSPHTKSDGTLKIPLSVVENHTNLKTPELLKAIEEISDKVLYRDGCFFVRSFTKRQSSSDTFLKGALKHIQETPFYSEWLGDNIHKLDTLGIGYAYPIENPVTVSDHDHDPKNTIEAPLMQDPENAPPEPVQVEPTKSDSDLVIDAWLSISRENGAHPVDSAKLRTDRRSLVAARLKEGHTIDDLVEAARGAWADPWYASHGKTQIRDIFKNADNVASYRARALTPKISATPVQDAKKQARIDELRRSFKGMEEQAKQMGIDLDVDPLEQEACR